MNLIFGEKLNNKEAHLFSDYVHPEYRNNRLQSALLATRLMYLHSQGYNKARALIYNNNTRALKTYASAGFRPTKAVTFFTIFGLKFHRWQKYIGIL